MLGKPDALRAFLDTARRELGSVDVLVNNASAFGFSDDEDGWQASFNVDLMGAVRASQIVTPWMAVGGGGAIVHISSLSGIEAGPTSVCRRQGRAHQPFKKPGAGACSTWHPGQRGGSRIH